MFAFARRWAVAALLAVGATAPVSSARDADAARRAHPEVDDAAGAAALLAAVRGLPAPGCQLVTQSVR